MGTRVGDVLAPRKPYGGAGQLARHPVSAASSYSDHQGVVEEGRGRVPTSSKVSKIAGMFQGGTATGGGGGGGGGGGSISSISRGGIVGGGDDVSGSSVSSHDGPQHATVVRTESHLARFNNARALFEKMGQGEASSTAPPPARFATGKPTAISASKGEAKPSSSSSSLETKFESKISKFETKAEASKTEVKKITGPTARTTLISQHLRRPPGGGGGGGGSSSSDERGSRIGRGESISPARSATGTSSSSSRSPSPSPARTTNGHAHHSDQETGVCGMGTMGIGAGVLGLRRPGSASSRSLSTSSTESEPPRRWPPGMISSSSSSVATTPDTTTTTSTTASSRIPSRPDSLKSDVDTLDLRRLKPEKPVKPEGLERKMSAHEQHQELIARHKNWFHTLSKNRSPASSPVKSDSRPGSPNKAEIRPPSPSKGEDLRPMSPSKSELRSTQPSKFESRSARSPAPPSDGQEDKSSFEDCMGEEEEEKDEESGEMGEKEAGNKKFDDQDAWSSVLQNRYGPRAKDILSPRGRTEGETSSDWRRERDAILSGRTCQRHSSSEDETSTPVKCHTRVNETASRFEDTATLQSSWSPPANYNQTETSYVSGPREITTLGSRDTSIATATVTNAPSTVVKTLKEEINNAETERTKNARHQAVRENGNAHENASSGGGGGGSGGGVGVGVAAENESAMMVAPVEGKEKADLIVSESVVIKDSTKEKDIEKSKEEGKKKEEEEEEEDEEKKQEESLLVKSNLSDVHLTCLGKREDLLRLKRQGSCSKETSEEVNLKLKESISGHPSLEEDISSSSYERKEVRQDYEERITKRKDEDRLGKREELKETRVRENGTESRRQREEIIERRRREEILERRKKDDSIDSWREEVSQHRRRREKKDESVRGKEKIEESSRVELSYRERSEERIRQIRKEREVRSRERRDENTENILQYKTSTESETSESVIERTKSVVSESAATPATVITSAHADDKVTTTSHHHHHHLHHQHHHHRTEIHKSTYEPKSYVSHARISTKSSSTIPSTTTTEPTPLIHDDSKTLPSETTSPPSSSESQTTAVVEEPLEEEVGGGEGVGDRVGEGEEVVETVVIGGVVSALKAETVYVSSSEDLSQNDDSKKESKLDIYQVDISEGDQKEKVDEGREKEKAKEREEEKEAAEERPEEEGEERKVEEEPSEDIAVRRQLFPDVVAECQQQERNLNEDLLESESELLSVAGTESGLSEPKVARKSREPEGGAEEALKVPTSPRTHSIAALDALIHGRVAEAGILEQQRLDAVSPHPAPSSALDQPEEEEIVYDHTVTSAQHKIQFCTTPVTVEGIAPDTESHDTDPEPLPPPIPPHAVDPEIMTADEAQRLLSAKESQSILSDEEAQEVVLLLSPQEGDSSKILPPPPVPPHNGDRLPSVPPHYDIPPAVPPHYADVAPPVPPHYIPSEDEFDTRVASHFDPTLASPLSPEDEPSEADSSEASGDVCQVSRVKEVLVEDGIHYLEDGHFWVEVPGLPEEDDEEDNDPMLPFHPHTKLSFSKDPIQVFSTYSVTEYDRKNDEVDPVAASAEYELEKRVEKMDLFPVEIIKGEGGLGLSIIGMGVGADAGVEKLGIFVKTITPGGATERDGRIQVNDQIIEVDGKSLVGVTQVFAASVLKNTSGRVHFLIGREKDPENSEVALLIKQSLQADREREERRRALGGPDYDPRNGHSIYDPLSSPSEENSRSEEASAPQNYSSYFEGGSSPTSPDAVSPPIESFDLEGDTSDTSPENDIAALKLKLKETQYRNAVAEAEITKLKMSLLEMEKIVSENTQYTSQLSEAQNQIIEIDSKLQSKLSEVSTYQDMLEQSQGQFIILEKKYYKAKKIIKEYQGRERDFLHREEYHITQLEEKDSHYNALVKALKDRVISLEEELKNAQKKAGLPVQVPSDTDVQPAYLDLQQSAQSALAKIPVKEELDEAVPPHELLDVSASRAKGELASRGGLANRHLPSLKKTTSMSSAGSQEHSLDDSSLDDELPESQKHTTMETLQDAQQEQGNWRSAEPQEISKLSQSPPQLCQSIPQPPPSSSQTSQNTSINSSISQVKSSQPPPYSHATMGSISYLGSPPPPYHPPPGQFGVPRHPLAPSDPSTGLPSRPLGATVDSLARDSRADSRPEIPYRHPPPVARVLPVNRAEISESATLAAHLANRTPQQQSLAEQLKALLAEREVQGDISQRNEREASPSKRSPTSLMEDVRQAVLQADVSSHVVTSGQLVQQVNSPNRSQTSGFYSVGGRDSIRDSSSGSQSPKLGRSSIHASPVSGVSANPAGVVLLSQRPLDSSLPVHKLGPDGSSGDLSSGPASLGSGDEGSGASLGSQTSLSLTHPPTDRTKRSHMWQTAPVVDWTKEQVSQWLVVQGLESCVSRFQDIGMTGPRLLNLDIKDLKSLGLPTDEKTKLKRKVKELRLAVEKERKQAEKEKKERERLQKKAEKLAEKAEKKKK